MAIVTGDARAMVEVIPVVVDADDNIISKGVPTLLSMAEFGERLVAEGGVAAASTGTRGVVFQAQTQAPAAAADVAALKTQFDALLTKLKAAGLMANA